MSEESPIEMITSDVLLEKVRAFRDQGYRLVQISAARLPEAYEITYSFDRDTQLTSIRLLLPLEAPHLASISSIYGCVLLYENEMHDLFGITVDGMAVDFHGNLYKTAVKFPFGSLKGPCAVANAEAKTAESAQPAAKPVTS
jgi:ech hydrogenase subunit D